ncbi:toprim domain-containing protein [Bartonella sp. CM87QHHN]|uniref:toprim domain-containing protein n=1 Tax=Bartonella sp. CM87QHHN TaxID=3243546 RepID=UPI0038578014
MSTIFEIKQKLISQADRIAEMLLPQGHKRGNNWIVGNTRGEAGQSLSICLSGSKAGLWYDFAESTGGDLLDLWCEVKGISLSQALEEARATLNLTRPKPFMAPHRSYRRPPVPTGQSPQNLVKTYLHEERRIPLEIIKRYRIGEDGEKIIFPFYKPDGTLALVKERLAQTGAKTKPTASQCEPILFGWQALYPTNHASTQALQQAPQQAFQHTPQQVPSTNLTSTQASQNTATTNPASTQASQNTASTNPASTQASPHTPQQAPTHAPQQAFQHTPQQVPSTNPTSTQASQNTATTNLTSTQAPQQAPQHTPQQAPTHAPQQAFQHTPQQVPSTNPTSTQASQNTATTNPTSTQAPQQAPQHTPQQAPTHAPQQAFQHTPQQVPSTNPTSTQASQNTATTNPTSTQAPQQAPQHTPQQAPTHAPQQAFQHTPQQVPSTNPTSTQASQNTATTNPTSTQAPQQAPQHTPQQAPTHAPQQAFQHTPQQVPSTNPTSTQASQNTPSTNPTSTQAPQNTPSTNPASTQASQNTASTNPTSTHTHQQAPTHALQQAPFPIFSSTNRIIVITEGEIDALSLAAYGYPAVSVPFGGGSGGKHNWIENEFDHLESFETIFLATDMDKPGEEAAREIASRLGRHRCYRVRLPLKDANDCLTAGIDKATIKAAFSSAQSFAPEGLRRASDYKDQVIGLFWPEPEKHLGYTVPYPKLKDKLHFRPAELTLWSGASGAGKSQLLSDCIPHWIAQKSRLCLASLEMKGEQSLRRLTKQTGGLEQPTKETIERILHFLDEGLILYEHVGKSSVDTLLDVFDYCRARYGCDQFIIDSLMRLGIASDDYARQEQAVYKMVDWAVLNSVHIHLVAHARKSGLDKDIPSTEDIKGASEIGANAFNIITIWRNRPLEDKIFAASLAQEKADLAKRPGVIMNIAKQRSGDFEGKIGLWFDPQTYRYRCSFEQSFPRRYL